MTPAEERFDTGPAFGPRHGLAAPRGQLPPPGSHGARFGRMFPQLPPCRLEPLVVAELLGVLAAYPNSPENETIPAGYTYLGQFIDHDITFDPASKLERDNDPFALSNFRTPRLDLDSLYGAGPADQPFLYDWSGDEPGVRLLVGSNRDVAHAAAVDLPRNVQGRALVGDARNDENLILSQLHLLFITFHNKVVDHLLAGPGPAHGGDLFEQAQRLVRWHFQWIVMHDFLDRIVGPDVAIAARDMRLATCVGDPSIPVEFSAAAYRFGHSMVRGNYDVNADAADVDLFRDPLGRRGRNLGGFRPLPALLAIQWRRFFYTDAEQDELSTRGEASKLIRSLNIDPALARPLRRLPPDDASLAELNLKRGFALGLPSGYDVAAALGVPAIPTEKLVRSDLLDRISADALAALRGATPLWYYVLREAERVPGASGQHLGAVGSRIVAGVLAGLIAADEKSYLHAWPRWRPTLRPPGGDPDDDFTMVDLLNFTHDPPPL